MGEEKNKKGGKMYISSCSKTWVSCDQLDASNCRPGFQVSDANTYISNFLKCRNTVEPRFCKTQEVCEAQGRCMGPSYQEQVCYQDSSYRHVCQRFENVCLIPTGSNKVCPDL